MHALVRDERQHAPAAVVQHLELDGAAYLIAGEHADEIVCAGDGDGVQRQNDVAGEQPCSFGGAARFDAGDHHRALLRESGCMPPASRKRELLGRDADIGAPYPAVSHQFAQHKARGVGCNRKADTLGAHDQRRVDPDNLAMGGDERPTRAVKLRPSTVVALTRLAFPTTWLLVSTRPSGATTTPDPVPSLRRSDATSSRTTAGPTRSTTSMTARE